MATPDPAPAPPPSRTGTTDAAEIARFEAMAADWWDPSGKFRPLHKLNPVRLAFLREKAVAHFGRDARSRRPLEGLGLLDIGCGGGLIAEPMARLGAAVTGLDASSVNVGIARTHAEAGGLSIDYRAGTAEALAASGAQFDIVLALEIVEHVADLGLFLESVAELVTPGGLLVLSTINRTPKALALAIIGAERILRWLPPGPHRYEKLVRPAELRDGLTPHGIRVHPPVGVSYAPLSDDWRLSHDVDVNYMMVGEKPA
ncbi:MAG: bifunctional 2-polyprenyl-6-hydroxyphenol methylase/3-demethylubiquinol 3-O-methyltransferase UbiG [Alphaproteobacteria bacterium]|nr:bifunctional 2-polyprenyl-6-hydroxyphenol methylase/3-demethylubiquinol 3-O-methyltransferase UbiG [Alphaproteobacteria bacterium]